MSQRRVGFAMACAAAVGCGGGHWSAENSWLGDEPKAHGSAEPAASAEAAPSTAEQPVRSGSTAGWLGVRHDLGIRPQAEKGTPCSCLNVVVGTANDPRLAWENGAPPTAQDTLAIAISARGVACPGGNADEAKRRASISAVDRNGADVLVEVEELPEGRPIASGAIIPRPRPGGSVYVRPKSRGVPYAAGARCKAL